MTTKTVYKTLPASVSHVTSGTYQREVVHTTTNTWVVGTEAEVAVVSDNIVADTANRDELFSWVRANLYIWNYGNPFAFEWMVLRQNTSDALPDLNDSATVEALQKDKRIFARGLEVQPHQNYGRIKPTKFELFNVKLRYGEELRLVIRPMIAAAATGYCIGVFEWRQVGE